MSNGDRFEDKVYKEVVSIYVCVSKMKANFNIEKDTWIVFKTMCSKLKAIEHGKERSATATDILKELIFEWITDHENLLNEVLEDMKKIGTQVKIEEWKT